MERIEVLKALEDYSYELHCDKYAVLAKSDAAELFDKVSDDIISHWYDDDIHSTLISLEPFEDEENMYRIAKLCGLFTGQ